MRRTIPGPAQGGATATGFPDLLRIFAAAGPAGGQPSPIGLFARPIGAGADWQTPIVRVWRDEDARRCRLCPICSAIDFGGASVCSVVAPGWIEPNSDAAAFFVLDGGRV